MLKDAIFNFNRDGSRGVGLETERVPGAGAGARGFDTAGRPDQVWRPPGGHQRGESVAGDQQQGQGRPGEHTTRL